MECPIAVTSPEIGTPPIQNRVQLLDHYIDSSVRWERPHYFANPVANIEARLLAWPHVQHPPRSLPKLEAEKREPFCQRRQPTLFLIHDQVESTELSLQLRPCLPRLLFRSREQYHVVRISGPAEHCRVRIHRPGTIDDLLHAERCWTAMVRSPRPEENPGPDEPLCLPP